ncbi:MAG: hypothetical protein RL662_2480 [Bacteroidota bacterium]|jgi:putative intracellular protease/amidase
MGKRVAVISLNPVNGMGLFQYLEAFYENQIAYTTFAVADTKEVKTNSGVSLILDDVIANLKGHEDEYDALVFSCGDAMLTFTDNADKQYYQDMFAVIKKFNDKGKVLAGHCAAALVFEKAGVADGKKVAIHPYGKSFLEKSICNDKKAEVDGNLYTMQSENSIWELMRTLVKVLKD